MYLPQSSTLPIRTVRFGEEMITVAAGRELLRRGFYTSAIFFPTVAQGEADLRNCLTSAHSIKDINAFCDAIKGIRGEIERKGSDALH